MGRWGDGEIFIKVSYHNMRYSVFHNYKVHRIFSLFSVFFSLFPVPCSLKQNNLYLTQLQTALRDNET
ncbi:MAG: hypothetical protein F6J90_04810 [Moorea sp. SIOASIH]|uniref:hypothetical protein n=1 Tax=Moorena sp. SIOASIH TaxID=2607817 RepID=UPI0013BAD087|nr:hypothetical protein [Moorena sp. SIOASIH]NEO35676.1 hypothetical protein [Moorena sp. SIOASIH]